MLYMDMSSRTKLTEGVLGIHACFILLSAPQAIPLGLVSCDLKAL